MGKSQHLRHRDLRAIYLLIGECCELGADPVAWQLHLIRSLMKTLDSAVGVAVELERVAEPGRRDDWLRTGSFLESGSSKQSEVPLLRQYAREGRWGQLPIFAATAGVVRPLFTFARRHVLEDRLWYGSDFIRRFMRESNLDDLLASLAYASPGSASFLGLTRPRGAPPFDRREYRLFHLGNRELVRLRGTRLATDQAPSATRLAPRLRQVLLCLFEGDSEKQVAARLGISRDTVHEYVRRLHRIFEASSRGELLARCVPFLPSLRGQLDPHAARRAPDSSSAP